MEKEKFGTDLAEQNVKDEIAHLEKLLELRKDEYKIFGSTSDDVARDYEISQKIYELKHFLKVK